MTNNHPVSLGYQLAVKFEQLSTSTMGNIAIGGMIADLAEHLGIDLRDHTPLSDDSRFMDLLNLRQAKVIIMHGPTFHMRFRQTQARPVLPDEEGRVDTDDQRN